MTPKELLEKHGGDPLAATVGTEYYDVLKAVLPTEQWDEAHGAMGVFTFVRKTIAHLGEDGAEKWGRALWAVVLWAGLDTRFTFAEFWELYKPFNALHLDGFTQITRIANATDRERLAACIVALAEGLQRNTI